MREYALCSSPHETYSYSDHIFRHIEVSIHARKMKKKTPCILSDHHEVQVDINKTRKNTKLKKLTEAAHYTTEWKVS